MAENKKISKIQLSGTTYDIDVADVLKVHGAHEPDDSVDCRVTTKSYVDQADAALEDKKLDKKPNGTTALIDSGYKISPSYLPDFILGQMKFGGVISGESGLFGASTLLEHAVNRDLSNESGLTKWSVWFGKRQPTLLDEVTDASTISIPEGFYFILNASISKEYADNTEALSAIADDFMVGDWLVVVGTGDTARWVKVDNTDAIKSINGKFGAVMLKGEDGVTIKADSFEVSGNNTDITIKGTTYTLEKADNKIRLVDNNNKVVNEVISGIRTLNGLDGTGLDEYGTGELEIVGGKNINVYTDADTKIIIDATVPEQVQADWNENDDSSPAYIKNRTHYEGECVEIVHTESIYYGRESDPLGYTFKDGETYEVCLFQSGVEEWKQFTVKPSDFKGNDYCLVGTFSLGADGEHGMTSIYLLGTGNGEYNRLTSLESENDGSGGMELGYVNFYTSAIKQLDAKYIPVDNETIKIVDGKLVGTPPADNVDFENINSNVNILGDHDLTVNGDINAKGDLNIDGAITFGSFAATSLKVTNAPADPDDVVNKAYFDAHAGQGGNVNLEDHHGNVKITGEVEIDGDLKFNGDFEIASLDAQSVKVNGKRVLVEGDAAGGSIAGITTGNVENSLEFFDGEASAAYAIAAGTNNKAPITNILGSNIAEKINVEVPKANGIASIAIAGGAEAKSSGGVAIGNLNTTGVYGYYYREINFDTKEIKLSTSRSSDAGTNLAANWKKDDIISFVNDSKFPACCKIAENRDSGNVIKVDSLPFSSADKIVQYEAYKDTSVLPLYLPDDFTIFAVYEKAEANGLNTHYYPREGTVELGWAGAALGIENLVTGSAGFAAGWNNWVAGDFGAAFGRNSTAGYAGIAAGYENKALATATAAFGRNNTINASYALAAGQSNTINNGNSAVFGYNNEANAASTFIAGDGNIANNYTQAVVGRYCNNEKTGNALFVVGNGSKNTSGEITRSNALVIDKDGTANIARTINVGDNTVTREHNIVAGESNTVNGPKNLVFGSDNTIASGKARILIAGTGNEAAESRGALIGQYNKIQTAGTFAIGLYNKTKNTTGQLVIGRGNAVVEDALFIVGNCSKIASAAATYTITDSDRSNAFVIHRDGRVEGGRSTDEEDSAWTLATKDYVDTHGGGSASFPTKAADGSALKDGAILVYKNGTWVAENPPTTIYLGEVE